MGKETDNRRKATGEIVAAAVLCAVFMFLTFLVVTENAALFAIDKKVAAAFYSIRTDFLTVTAKGISYTAVWQVISAICIVLLIIPATRMKVGIPVAVCSAVAVVTRIIIKLIVMRPRPDEIYWLSHESDSSFPSGHSCGAMAIYGFLAYLVFILVKRGVLSKVLSLLLLLLVLLVGLSRIYLGMHYPSDVLGGFCLGAIVILVVIAAMKRLQVLTMKGDCDEKI